MTAVASLSLKRRDMPHPYELTPEEREQVWRMNAERPGIIKLVNARNKEIEKWQESSRRGVEVRNNRRQEKAHV